MSYQCLLPSLLIQDYYSESSECNKRYGATAQLPFKVMIMQPHPSLVKHYQSSEKKQPFLRKLFDDSAKHYEGIAKWGWFNSGDWYRRMALRRAGLRGGMKTIDVAAGTGITARAILDIVGDKQLVTCIEPSAGMIVESKKLLDCEHIQAEAESIPLDDAQYDFLTMGFALRHVDNLDKAFAEYCRVLKPGGKALILDVTTPENPVGYFFMKLYFKTLLPFFTRVFTRSHSAHYLMAYYWDTMENMVDRAEVVSLLEDACFSQVNVRLNLGIFTEYEAIK